MKFLTLTLHLLAKITLTLISSSAVTGCVQKANLQFAIFLLYALCWLFEKRAVLCGNNSILQQNLGQLALCNKPLYKSVSIEKIFGLKLKMYSFLIVDSSDHKKANGVNENVVATISHNEYVTGYNFHP